MGKQDQDQARDPATQDVVAEPKNSHQPQRKPTSGAQADRMVASLTGGSSRLSSLAPQHDFGEQVLGSHDTAQIRAPWNLGDQQAVAHFSVSGEGFALTSAPSLTLPPSGGLSPSDLANLERASPTIQYQPTHVGAHAGTLTITAAWYADGHTETHVIALRGRARELTQAPSQERSTDEIAGEAKHARDQADNAKAVAEDAKKPSLAIMRSSS